MASLVPLAIVLSLGKARSRLNFRGQKFLQYMLHRTLFHTQTTKTKIVSVDKTFQESINNLDGGQPQKAIYRSSLTRFCKIKAHENTSELEEKRMGDSSMNCDLNIPTANQETVKSGEWAERKPPPGSYVFEIADTIVGRRAKKPDTGWFRNGLKRFKDNQIMGSLISDTPGPGRYQRMFEPKKHCIPRSRVDPRAGFSSATRFQTPTPGSDCVYNIEPTWVKKSFNITFAKQKMANVKKKRA